MTLIAMALIVAAALVAQYIVYDNFALKSLSYKLHISTKEAYEGDEIEIIEEIENAKPLPLPWIRTEISCSRWLSFKGRQISPSERNEQRGLISGVLMLKGRQKCRRIWKVRCEKRGIMTIDDVSLSASDLLGLAKPSTVFSINESVRVLPVPSEIEEPPLSGDRFFGNMTVRRFVLPDPFVISGAREYTGREPMNRIHQLQTARTGELMVYNNEYTTERRILIMINMQRNAVSDTQTLALPILEAQIKAAAFMIDLCGVMRAGFGVAANDEGHLVLPQGEGYEHAVNALRALAELKNTCGGYAEDFLADTDNSDYTDVILITSFLTEKMAERLDGISRGGKCCLVMSTTIGEDDEFLPQTVGLVHIPRPSFLAGYAGE